MGSDLVKFVDLVPMSTTKILQRKAEIANIGKKVMKEADFKKGVHGHFGVIPGTKTNCLLKAGAQLLCMVFHISPKYETEKFELEDGHREYESVCNGYQMGTGIFLGQGAGSCSTLESKYRYRYEKGGGENTGKPLPGKYWGEKKKETEGGDKSALNIIGGKGFFPKKLEDGRWMIFKKTEAKKVPNPDIADQYNTVKKQSNKRALVDMVLQVLAAGDMFTQDQYENIIDKLKSEDSIDVPWSEVAPEQQPETKEAPKFDPESFSSSNTSAPGKPSPKPPAQEKKEETAKPKEEKESSGESPATIRGRVISFVDNNQDLHDELFKRVKSLFPDYRTKSFLDIEMLKVSEYIPDPEIKKMDSCFQDAGLYK